MSLPDTSIEDPEWWENPQSLYFVERALANLDDGGKQYDPQDACRKYFDALNLLFTGIRNLSEVDLGGEEAALRELLRRAPRRRREDFLSSSVIAAVRDLSPNILDQSVLNKARYDPFLELSEDLRKKASFGHRKFNNAVDRYKVGRTVATADALCNKVASLLTIVRNNIAHGEKTPKGPDLQKRRRDELVCRIVAPLAKGAAAAVIGNQETSLAVYGTLKKGETNSSELAIIEEALEGEAPGKLLDSDGLSFFEVSSWRYDDRVPIQYMSSVSLMELWEKLDAFEGERYRRQSVVVKLLNGRYRVAQIYGLAGE